jgi:hypothetical protein
MWGDKIGWALPMNVLLFLSPVRDGIFIEKVISSKSSSVGAAEFNVVPTELE